VCLLNAYACELAITHAQSCQKQGAVHWASVGTLWREPAPPKRRPDKSRVRWAFELFGPNFRLLSGLGRFAAFHMAELRFARRF
jgi:hypothetical protein